MYHQTTLTVHTEGRGSYDLTGRIARFIEQTGVRLGLCHVFLQHTSASLMLCENADPAVRSDLERFMAALVPDGDPMFRHRSEGPDDMPAHVRTVLTQSGLTLPVSDARPGLGTWQGLYLWEHRTAAHRRQVMLTVHGE